MKRRDKIQISRMIGYRYFAPAGAPSVDETPLERVLESAKRDGVVLDYDTGRGRVVWFDGRPGPALRKIRDRVRAMLPSNWTN